jgi:hypothetical protein
MIPVAAGVLAFALAFAGWRWGLGSRNWIEGGLFATIVGVLSGLLTQAVLRALEAAGRA